MNGQTAVEDAKAILVGLDRKVVDEDVIGNAVLQQAAEDYTLAYSGTFEFMVSMKADAQAYGFGRWSAGKYRGVLNCLRAAALNEVRRASEAEKTNSKAAGLTGERKLPNGTYTAVFADSSHRTIRVKPHWIDEEAKNGVQVLQFLSGPDNESSYTGFAFLAGTKVRLWKRFANEASPLIEALKIILRDPAKAGETYALESNNCFRCGRKLTVPVSIHRGLGPICAAKWGVDDDGLGGDK